MKKLIFLIFAVLSMGSAAFAMDAVWRSSNTATAETTAPLCGGTRRGQLFKVVISSAVSGHVTVWNSSWTSTAVTSVGPIMATTLGEYEFLTNFTGGMSYTKNGASQVQIMYNCY